MIRAVTVRERLRQERLLAQSWRSASVVSQKQLHNKHGGCVLEQYNSDPTPSVWTKDADMIVAETQRCKEALGTQH